MAGVHRDDDVPLPVEVRDLDRHRRLRRRPAVAEVDDEPVAVGFVRRRQEALRLHFLRDVEDDAKALLAPCPEADRFHDACRRRQRERADVRVDRLEVDHDAVRPVEREERVTRRRRQVEHDARGIGAAPDADVLERGRRGERRRGGDQQERQGNPLQWPHGSWTSGPAGTLAAGFL